MINRILTAYAQQLEQFMVSFFHQPEGVVEVAPIANYNDDEPAKLILALTGLERETIAAVSANQHRGGDGRTFGTTHPPIYMNMNIVMAAVYPKKRYRESLAMLTKAIECLQANPSFRTVDGNKYTIEIMDQPPQTNGIRMGEDVKYYPSVACKIRRLTFDAREVNRTLNEIKTTEL